MIRKPVPKFKSEAEEAAWWDRHSDEADQWMEEAVKNGQTTTLAAVLQRARSRRHKSPAAAVSVRIAGDDAARARSIAAKKGLTFQSYVKTVVHKALVREEKRLAR